MMSVLCRRFRDALPRQRKHINIIWRQLSVWRIENHKTHTVIGIFVLFNKYYMIYNSRYTYFNFSMFEADIDSYMYLLKERLYDH